MPGADSVASNVAIRRAEVVDAPALARLFEEMPAERDRPGSDQDFVRALAGWMALDGARHLTWIAEAGGHPIGMVWMHVIPRPPRPHLRNRFSADLQTFWVRPTFRNRGVGRRLLDAVLAEAERRGLERVVVHTSEGAVSLYERAGFQPDERTLVRTL